MDILCPFCHNHQINLYWIKKGYHIYQCKECDLLFLHPLPTPGEATKQYDQSYHSWMDKIDPISWRPDPQDQKKFNRLEKRASLYLKYLSNFASPPGRLLDIGCTAGFFLRKAKSAGWQVEGLEVNPLTANIAREALDTKIYNSSIEEASLGSNSYDAITAWDILPHLADPRTLLKKAHNLLRENGFLCTSCTNYRGLFPQVSYRAAKIIDYWPHFLPPIHIYDFSQFSIRNLLRDQGFEVLKIYHKPIYLDDSFGYLNDILKSYKRILYTMAFIGPKLLGPLINRGDHLFIVAAKE